MFLHNKEIVAVYDQLYQQDERIWGLIDLLKEYNQKLKSEVIQEKISFSFNIKLDNLDHLAEKCFPLCMSEIFKGLWANH